MVTEDEGTGSPVKKKRLLGRKVRLWGAGILALLVLILVIQNTQTVTVSVLFWHRPMPLVILILLMFSVGMLLGYLLRRTR